MLQKIIYIKWAKLTDFPKRAVMKFQQWSHVNVDSDRIIIDSDNHHLAQTMPVASFGP